MHMGHDIAVFSTLDIYIQYIYYIQIIRYWIYNGTAIHTVWDESMLVCYMIMLYSQNGIYTDIDNGLI